MMAFSSRLGSLVKQTVSLSSSMYQSIRCMSSSKVFIGGLSYSTDEESLNDAFRNYGEVIEAKVVRDRETGRSRGFGFVTFTSTDEASAAISGMDAKDLQGRIIRVNYANDRRPSSFGGGGYGGRYGGGGYGGAAAGYGGGGGFDGGNGGAYGGVDRYGSGGGSDNYGSAPAADGYGDGGGSSSLGRGGGMEYGSGTSDPSTSGGFDGMDDGDAGFKNQRAPPFERDERAAEYEPENYASKI